jgi:4-amino-4-deoxy-L-arabinose transferase-like glycosyltransferase
MAEPPEPQVSTPTPAPPSTATATPVLEPAAAPRRAAPRAIEVLMVITIAAAMLVPGIWRYSLVDPWETHYGEVARNMLADDDWVHLDWKTYNEGFRSKPVLTFWLMASSMKLLGVAADGGYSGEITASSTTMLAIRLPFTLLAVMALTLMWWALARLISRRMAWLALLTVGTCPFFFFVARQGITDMTMVAPVMAALAMFLLACEDGEDPVRPLGRVPLGPGLGHLVAELAPWAVTVGPPRTLFGRPLWRRRWTTWDARWPLVILLGGFLAVQAIYYFTYFQLAQFRTIRNGWPQPGWILAGGITFGLLYIFAPRVFLHGRALVIRPFVPTWARAYQLAGPSLPSYLVGLILSFNDPWQVAHARARELCDLRPLRARRGSIYVLWFWGFVGFSVLGKGLPGFGIAGVVCALAVIFQNRWHQLWAGVFEIKRGVILLVVVVVPWHVAMWMREGSKFISEWIFFHNLKRAGEGVHGQRGTFDYVIAQAGYGMFLWAALVPLALAALALVKPADPRAGRVRFVVGAWAIVATGLFSISQTKFHHYILPAVPACAIAVAFWLDDLLARRIKPSLVFGALAAGLVLLLARDMMHEEKQWIEMFTYRDDRPWPSMPPWSIDTSDAFLVMGLGGAAAMFLLGTRLRRLAVAATAAAAIGCALWAMHVYMPIAGTHWGMREAVRKYYQERQIYGAKLVYYTPRDFRDEWAGPRGHWDVETFIPDAYQDGQPMTVTIEVQGGAGERFKIPGTSRAIGDHTIRIELDPAELNRVRDIARIAAGPRGRRPTRVVDADRLIAWQLYWRGENFWSGNEVWGPLPEMQTALKEADNVAFKRYLNDRNLAPEGRRYFIVTEAGRTGALTNTLPTETARQTVKVIETTSNKFSLAVFQL